MVNSPNHTFSFGKLDLAANQYSVHVTEQQPVLNQGKEKNCRINIMINLRERNITFF